MNYFPDLDNDAYSVSTRLGAMLAIKVKSSTPQGGRFNKLAGRILIVQSRKGDEVNFNYIRFPTDKTKYARTMYDLYVSIEVEAESMVPMYFVLVPKGYSLCLARYSPFWPVQTSTTLSAQASADTETRRSRLLSRMKTFLGKADESLPALIDQPNIELFRSSDRELSRRGGPPSTLKTYFRADFYFPKASKVMWYLCEDRKARAWVDFGDPNGKVHRVPIYEDEEVRSAALDANKRPILVRIPKKAIAAPKLFSQAAYDCCFPWESWYVQHDFEKEGVKGLPAPHHILLVPRAKIFRSDGKEPHFKTGILAQAAIKVLRTAYRESNDKADSKEAETALPSLRMPRTRTGAEVQTMYGHAGSCLSDEAKRIRRLYGIDDSTSRSSF